MRVFWSIGRIRSVAPLAAAVLLAGAGAATAKTIVEIAGVASPPVIRFTTTPQILNFKLDIDFSTDVPGTDPGTITKAALFFPHGPRVNGALFPSCSPAKLQRMQGSPNACPHGSRLGTGTALGTSPQFHGVLEHLKMDVYNGPGGRSLLLYLRGLIPVAIGGMINAPFRAIHSHRWAYKLTINVPRSLQKLGGGIYASLLHVTTRVGGTVRVRENGRMVKHGYIEALACPPGALVPIGSEWSFLGGSSATANGYVSCGPR